MNRREQCPGCLLPAAVLLAALLLRLFGIAFGAPYWSNFYIRPDESLVVQPALQFFELHGDTRVAAYPSLMTAWCAVLFELYARLDGAASAVVHFSQNPTAHVVIARLVAALASSATVWVVYATARRMAGRTTGLFAASLLACAPLAVRDGHFGVTDSFLILFCALVLLELVRFVDAPHPAPHARRTAIWTGAALASKYHAVLLIPFVFGVILWSGWSRDRRAALRTALTTGLIAAAVFLLLNPQVFHSGKEIVASLGGVASALLTGRHSAVQSTRALAWETLWQTLTHGPGGVVGLGLAALAVFLSLRGKAPPAVPVLALGFLIFLAPLALSRGFAFRYALPLFPFLALLAGCGFQVLRESTPKRWRAVVVSAIALAALAPTAWTSARLSARLQRDDTRALAGRWVVENLEPRVPVAVFGWPESEPQLPESHDSIRRRMDYTRRRYGPSSADVIGRLYALQLRGPESIPGYDVYRNPSPGEISGGELCVILPAHPLPMAGYDAANAEALLQGEILQAVEFKGLRAGRGDFAFDATDAFFLPLNRLGDVLRPGPDLRILHVRRR